MADATNTAWPLARDPLPEIGPNTQEDAGGVEHDVMHDKANALLNALQDLIGTATEAPAQTVLARLLALESGGSAATVPTRIADGKTFAVPVDTQVLWAMPIELDGAASIDVGGAFVEVV